MHGLLFLLSDSLCQEITALYVKMHEPYVIVEGWKVGRLEGFIVEW